MFKFMNEYIKQSLETRIIYSDSVKFFKKETLYWNELKELAREISYDNI